MKTAFAANKVTMSEQDIQKLFKEMDFDEDGRINFDDFIRVMMAR